jgi:hypothetical protein
MKLVIPGLARTATKSLWRFFQEHPDVATSRIKEPLRLNKIRNYLDYFDINGEEFIFDGTPDLTNYSIIHELKSHSEITEIYQIWFNRDPGERAKSYIRRMSRFSIEDMKSLKGIIFKKDMNKQLAKAKSILGDENVFVSDIDQDVERRIEKFLGITVTEIQMPWDKH